MPVCPSWIPSHHKINKTLLLIMAASSGVSFLLLCLVVIQTCLCFAQELPFQWEDQTPWQPRQQGRSSHRLQQREECDLWSLTAAEPSSRFQSEGGVTEYWDPNQQQLRCAGVVVVRHVIEPQGLLLPAYGNAPHITYIIQGKGIFGATIPGCPQPFQSESRGERHSRRFTDEHEKIRRFHQGDVIAMPAGVTRWVYNDGDSRLIGVSFYDTSSFQNQLDGDLRKFYLAGTRQLLEPRGERRIGGHLQLESHNIFSGFDQELLADALGVNVEIAKKLQGLNDNRGNIVLVDRSLRLLSPEYQEEERRSEERRRINGLETTFCNLRLTHNIDTPSDTDIYNPRGGRMTTVNSQKLPILAHLRLSAQRVVLYEVYIYSHNCSPYCIIYVNETNPTN
ncbi:hypothetical protein Dimus_028638 [Dionaea muscipula]